MITKKEAEDSILGEMLKQHAEREKTGDMTDKLIVPSASTDEIGERIKRASDLSSNSPLRIGMRFLNETNPKLS